MIYENKSKIKKKKNFSKTFTLSRSLRARYIDNHCHQRSLLVLVMIVDSSEALEYCILKCFRWMRLSSAFSFWGRSTSTDWQLGTKQSTKIIRLIKNLICILGCLQQKAGRQWEEKLVWSETKFEYCSQRFKYGFPSRHVDSLPFPSFISPFWKTFVNTWVKFEADLVEYEGWLHPFPKWLCD